MEATKKQFSVVFNHHETKEILESLGFKKIGNKSGSFSLYMNNETNVVSYYVQKDYTPEYHGAFIFIHGDKKQYAYNIDEFKNVYESLINDII